MLTQTDCPSSTREGFRCTGEQLDAIVRFAEERGLEHQPLHFVVAQWRRSQLDSLRPDAARCERDFTGPIARAA
jgi:hypothetical protein